MKTLRPVEVSEYYINQVAYRMRLYFWDNIFKELFEILGNNVSNSKDGLIKQLKSGHIWYENGAFRTKDRFSNEISKTLEKLGARYRRNAFYIERNNLPKDIAILLDELKTLTSLKVQRVDSFLTRLQTVLAGVSLKEYLESTVKMMFKKLQLDIIKSAEEGRVPVVELDIVAPKLKLPKQKAQQIEAYWHNQEIEKRAIQKQIKEAIQKGYSTEKLEEQLEKITKNAYINAPKIDLKIEELELDKQSQKIAEDYTYNLEYWVKKWEAKNIIKMRQDVLKMVQEGARVPRIQEYFEQRWKVAKDKAKFLAVNESHLAGSVIKATDYQQMGCQTFTWGRSSSKEKRKLHEEYYDEVFRFDNPPIIDEKLGIRGLPRQIWNCKCHMLINPPSVDEILDKMKEVQNAKRNIFTKLQYKIRNRKQCNNSAWRYRRYGEG